MPVITFGSASSRIRRWPAAAYRHRALNRTAVRVSVMPYASAADFESPVLMYSASRRVGKGMNAMTIRNRMFRTWNFFFTRETAYEIGYKGVVGDRLLLNL